MPPNLKIAALVAGLAFLGLSLVFLKRNALQPSYAALWLGIALFLLTMPVLGRVYQYLATSILGLSGGDHVIYLGVLGFLLCYTFYLTSKICKMSSRITHLISTTAILEHELRKRRDTEERRDTDPGTRA